MAAEVYDEADYDEIVDIHSFALMLYETVVARPVLRRTLTLAASRQRF
jgi:hypothetical protein